MPEKFEQQMSISVVLNRYLDRLESFEDCERLLMPIVQVFEDNRREDIRQYIAAAEADNNGHSESITSSVQILINCKEMLLNTIRLEPQ